MNESPIRALPLPPQGLGESPFWHPDEQALYWVDIPGRAIHRWQPAVEQHRHWSLGDSALDEPGCIAPLAGGRLLLAQRRGLCIFDPASGRAGPLLAPPPYDPAHERFNDGKADAQGRLWVGTIYEPRDKPAGALYCWAAGKLERVMGEVTVSNGLTFDRDGRGMSWSDTKAHRIDRLRLEPGTGAVRERRPWVQFEPRAAGQALADYGGRPDGAALDSEGACWVAMFEGQRLLRLAPDGRVLKELRLPVRCPTMPCFGGPDLKTLYVTTACHGRPADELAAQPLAGCVLELPVPVAGLPVHFAHG
jgi:sugar lactone lactonase YvrE